MGKWEEAPTVRSIFPPLVFSLHKDIINGIALLDMDAEHLRVAKPGEAVAAGLKCGTQWSDCGQGGAPGEKVGDRWWCRIAACLGSSGWEFSEFCGEGHEGTEWVGDTDLEGVTEVSCIQSKMSSSTILEEQTWSGRVAEMKVMVYGRFLKEAPHAPHSLVP